MAKKSIIVREKKRAELRSRYSERRKDIVLKLRKPASYQEWLLLIKEMDLLPRASAPSRQRNRCWKTGRSRSFYRDFGLCRHAFREIAHEGHIPGLTKSSW